MKKRKAKQRCTFRRKFRLVDHMPLPVVLGEMVAAYLPKTFLGKQTASWKLDEDHGTELHIWRHGLIISDPWRCFGNVDQPDFFDFSGVAKKYPDWNFGESFCGVTEEHIIVGKVDEIQFYSFDGAVQKVIDISDEIDTSAFPDQDWRVTSEVHPPHIVLRVWEDKYYTTCGLIVVDLETQQPMKSICFRVPLKVVVESVHQEMLVYAGTNSNSRIVVGWWNTKLQCGSEFQTCVSGCVDAIRYLEDDKIFFSLRNSFAVMELCLKTCIVKSTGWKFEHFVSDGIRLVGLRHSQIVVIE